MATIDMTHRKLKFPPRFLPYLEKHRIFELFHECVELLVQVKPKDHIRFLKSILPCAAMKKDKQRIVFISPPSFGKFGLFSGKINLIRKIPAACPIMDRISFCEFLADCLEIQIITSTYLEILTKEKITTGRVEVETESQEKEGEEEEESCICPGEDEFGYLYYPSEEVPFHLESVKSESTEEYKEEFLLEKPPCICVCPCVKSQENNENNENEEKEGEKEGDKKRYKERDKEGDQKEDHEVQKESWSGESLSFKSGLLQEIKPQGSFYTEVSSEKSSAFEIDFGILKECEVSALGWILQDFPKTGAEAEKLNSIGVIPTHALRIIIDEEKEENDSEYKMAVKSWMRAYEFVPVRTIRMKNREILELAKDLCSLLSIMPHRHAPMLPRIVLIGSRGSGVTTQGQKLSRKYGLVHVEFEIVIAQALQQDDDICKLYKQQLATRPDPELEAYILERALLTSPCRNRGWVLTGYPRNCDDMRMLDIIATPPNRVIFIEVPARECFVRLYYRKIDGCLGDEYKIPMIEPFGQDSYVTPNIDSDVAARLLSHPKDNKKQIIHDIEQYFLEKKNIMAYCGKTASYIDGDQEVDKVFELIEQILINPGPAQLPRDPLSVNHGIEESYERLKKFRLTGGLFFNNLFLNPPEKILRQ